jgi:hypothetical protein
MRIAAPNPVQKKPRTLFNEWRVDFRQPSTPQEEARSAHAMWRNDGAMVLYWRLQGGQHWAMRGYVTAEELKNALSPQQWDDFWSGRTTTFIVERTPPQL